MSRMNGKKTHTHTQYNGGLLPDIILLTQCYYHRGTRLNAMKRFCICSLRSHLNVLTFSPLSRGCSESLGAFIFFKNITIYRAFSLAGRQVALLSSLSLSAVFRMPTLSLEMAMGYFTNGIPASTRDTSVAIEVPSTCGAPRA